MRKFHFIVAFALEKYRDRPFTKKSTITEEVEYIFYLFFFIEQVPIGKRQREELRDLVTPFSREGWDYNYGRTIYNDFVNTSATPAVTTSNSTTNITIISNPMYDSNN